MNFTIELEEDVVPINSFLELKANVYNHSRSCFMLPFKGRWYPIDDEQNFRLWKRCYSIFENEIIRLKYLPEHQLFTECYS